eukprot:TRINITY_DN10459_c0_g1_i4.p1 TRINITY_DN10459_c0_g1~~TRINITY_DN10459_c0_g1_i4.p1  ORF type:complete len:340 (-),score=52.90 TRINITY_DN10459_c0_g1_i4:148-1167(-)
MMMTAKRRVRLLVVLLVLIETLSASVSRANNQPTKEKNFVETEANIQLGHCHNRVESNQGACAGVMISRTDENDVEIQASVPPAIMKKKSGSFMLNGAKNKKNPKRKKNKRHKGWKAELLKKKKTKKPQPTKNKKPVQASSNTPNEQARKRGRKAHLTRKRRPQKAQARRGDKKRSQKKDGETKHKQEDTNKLKHEEDEKKKAEHESAGHSLLWVLLLVGALLVGIVVGNSHKYSEKKKKTGFFSTGQETTHQPIEQGSLRWRFDEPPQIPRVHLILLAQLVEGGASRTAGLTAWPDRRRHRRPACARGSASSRWVGDFSGLRNVAGRRAARRCAAAEH